MSGIRRETCLILLLLRSPLFLVRSCVVIAAISIIVLGGFFFCLLALPEGNCIKLGLPGKSILRDYFQENRIPRRPFLLLRIRFPGRPIFIQFFPVCIASPVELCAHVEVEELSHPGERAPHHGAAHAPPHRRVGVL